jgi:DNA-binding response OmpR family regulator/HPt (histidine-containing phosphotransfer) domain-containing protein
MRILLVEDDDAIATVLAKSFADEHYAVDVAQDGYVGWQLVNAFDYDLIVLDVVLPKLDGIQFCQRLRDYGYHMPVLIVTALDSSTRKIAGLDAGADDYITKPFQIDELLARVRVLLRRAQTPILSMLEWGALQLNPNTREVTFGEHLLNLTPKEYRLLELFLRKPSQVFSRSAILDRLWSSSDSPGEDTVTAHIKGLRRKLTQVGAPADLIKTVYGVGYRLKPLEGFESPGMPTPTSLDSPKNLEINDQKATLAATSVHPALAKQQQTQVTLRSLWQRLEAQQGQRLNTLKQAVEAIAINQLPPHLHQQAQRAAHSLKGSLGIFGLTTGSELAQRLEHQLAVPWSDRLCDPNQLRDWVIALEQEVAKGPSLPEPATPTPGLPLLMILDDLAELTPDIAQAGRDQGVTVQIWPTDQPWPALREQLNAGFLSMANSPTPGPSLPVANWIMINLRLQTMPESNQQQLLAIIGLMAPALPVLVCSANGSLHHRIQAARLGASTFLYNPTVAEIIDWGMTLQAQPVTARVLMVDDDPDLLEALPQRLLPWGLHLTTLASPAQLWSSLHRVAPDLLLLDIEMPGFNGLELCRVVRQSPLWHHLPIVFLTAYTDISHSHAAMLAGANDVIDKALPGPELVQRLLQQLKPTPSLPCPLTALPLKFCCTE